MAEPVPDIVDYQADVAVFRAVLAMSPARLKDIICTHYGAKHFDAELQRGRGVSQGSTGGNNNLVVYLAITNRFGKKPEAMKDILSVYRDDTRTECETKGRVEALDSIIRPPLLEPGDPDAIANTAIEAADSIADSDNAVLDSDNKGGVDTIAWDRLTLQPPLLEPSDPAATDNAAIAVAESAVENAQSTSDYLEAFYCNTTRSCCLYPEEHGIGYYYDDDCKDDEWCSDQDVRFTARAPLCVVAVQGGDKPECQHVSQDEPVMTTPGLVIYEDCC